MNKTVNNVEKYYPIQVKNVVKKFGSFTAVDDVSFEVEEGEVFGWLGRMAPARRP
jgi:ABC-2 type transport system ATP-binding protein